MKQFNNLLFLFLPATILILSGFVSAMQKAESIRIELPAPAGPYAVGRQSFHWTDHSRKESLTPDPSDWRELMIYIWYPAQQSTNATLSPYIPDLELLKGSIDSSQFSILNSVQTHTFTDAKLLAASARYPVLIFSHGNQMNSLLYTSIIEDLVSHGFIVATIDHPYEAIFTLFPDGRVIPYSEQGRPKSDATSSQRELMAYLKERINSRAADMVFVINQLAEMNASKTSRFRDQLNMARIGTFGHSNGGTAAALACQMDKRIKACINLDGRAEGGPFYLDSNGRGPEQPLMYLAKPLREFTNEELAKQNITREQSDQQRARILKRDNDLMQSVKSGSYRVIIKGAAHESFSDEPLLLPETNANTRAANQKMIGIIREYTLAFFDKYLTDKKPVRLDSITKQQADITIERFGSALK